jgi:hypothetical protein
MKMSIKWMIVAMALLAGPNAMSQETLMEHVVNACQGDLDKYCSQVTPGQGRVLYCMAAHEDKISGQCQYAFYQAATLLEQLSMAVSYIAQECKADIEKHCANVEMGEGRILACLSGHDAQVSDGCKKAIADTVAE